MLHSIWIVGFLIPISLIAQTDPGGVTGVKIWIQPVVAENKIQWIDLRSKESYKLPKLSYATVNHNPALILEGNSGFSLQSRYLSASKTVFTVSKSFGTKEQIIWHINVDEKPLVQTTHRVADLSKGTYLNLNSDAQLKPKIQTYAQAAKKPIKDAQLVFGLKPRLPEIPIETFNGILAEFIIYDRVLKIVEKQQIESYLAIKYSIPLNQKDTTDYLDSQRRIIWDAHKDYEYSNNVGGVGIDRQSGLRQLISTTEFEAGDLTISTEGSTYNDLDNMKEFDQSFLIWGEDNGPFEFSDEIIGSPSRLDKEWKCSATNLPPKFKTNVKVNPNDEILDQKEQNQIWLAIDRSGRGEFDFSETEYFNARTDGNQILFENIEWDVDSSGSDIFTLVKAPKMFTTFRMMSPLCNFPNAGQININIVGGSPPFRLELSSSEKSKEVFWTKERQLTLDEINIGKYQLLTHENGGLTYEQTITMHAMDSPPLDVEKLLYIVQGKPIILNASDFNPNIIVDRWLAGNEEISTNNSLDISNPGTYTLIGYIDQCKVIKDFQVVTAISPDLISFNAYPNPTINGRFKIEIELKESDEAVIEITDSHGRIIDLQRLKGSNHYLLKKNLTVSDLYFLNLRTKDEVHSLKLISVK